MSVHLTPSVAWILLLIIHTLTPLDSGPIIITKLYGVVPHCPGQRSRQDQDQPELQIHKHQDRETQAALFELQLHMLRLQHRFFLVFWNLRWGLWLFQNLGHRQLREGRRSRAVQRADPLLEWKVWEQSAVPLLDVRFKWVVDSIVWGARAIINKLLHGHPQDIPVAHRDRRRGARGVPQRVLLRQIKNNQGPTHFLGHEIHRGHLVLQIRKPGDPGEAQEPPSSQHFKVRFHSANQMHF